LAALWRSGRDLRSRERSLAPFVKTPPGRKKSDAGNFFEYNAAGGVIMRVMSTRVLMDVEEYLRTSFEGSDCEFLDGEVVERNWGDFPHATMHGQLAYLLSEMRPQLGIRVLMSIRLRISPRRYRVADIAVWRDSNIGTG